MPPFITRDHLSHVRFRQTQPTRRAPNAMRVAKIRLHDKLLHLWGCADRLSHHTLAGRVSTHRGRKYNARPDTRQTQTRNRNHTTWCAGNGDVHAPYSAQANTTANQRIRAVLVNGRILVLAQRVSVLTTTGQRTPIVYPHVFHHDRRRLPPTGTPNHIQRTLVAARLLRTHHQPRPVRSVHRSVLDIASRNVFHVPVKPIPVRIARRTERFPSDRRRIRVRRGLVGGHATTALTTRRTVQLMVRHLRMVHGYL